MPPKKRVNGKPSLGLECGLEIPKFLQDYKDMLGENSVFSKQLRRERESGYQEIDEIKFEKEEDEMEEKKEDKVNVSQTTESELQKRERIMSNKNNALIHELSKKLIANESSKGNHDKKDPPVTAKPEAKKTQTASIGKPLSKKRPAAEKKVDVKRKKGMLAFEQDSDSDRLYSVFNKHMIPFLLCACESFRLFLPR